MQLLARHAARAGSGQAVLRFRCPHCGTERGIVYVPLEPLHLSAAPGQSAAKAVHCPSCDGVFYRRELRQGQEIIMEAFANPSGWLPPEMIAPMPSRRRFVGAVMFGGKLLVLGGISSTGSARLTTVESYDPTENTWVSLQPLAGGAAGPAVLKGQKIWQYGANNAVVYNVADNTSKRIAGISSVSVYSQSAADAFGSKLFLADSGRFYEVDSESELVSSKTAGSIGSYSNLSWDQEANLYYSSSQVNLAVYSPDLNTWASRRLTVPGQSAQNPGRSFVANGELYGFNSWTSGQQPDVWKLMPGSSQWVSSAKLDKAVNGPAFVNIEGTQTFLVVDGASEWPIQFYEPPPTVRAPMTISLRTNEVPVGLPVSFESPATKMPVDITVSSTASIPATLVVPQTLASKLPTTLDIRNIDAHLAASFEVLAVVLAANFSIPFGRLLQSFFSVDATQIGRRTLRSYLSVPGAPVKRLGISFTAPRTVIVGGGAIQPGEIHAASISLTATEKDQWQGSITSYTPLKPGTIALRIANIEVLANIEQVQVALVGGQTTYTGQIRPIAAPSLNKVITNDLPEDPVIALEANGGYVSPQQIFNLRKAAARPTAREYFEQAGEFARVVILIDPDVPGADMPLPYRDVWTGSGKTFQAALTEVFGFAKPRIYVDSIGRIRVSRRRRPREFGKFIESPQSRTIAGSLAPLAESVPTFYAGPASILLPMAGGSKATNLDILRKKHGSSYPDLEYYAEWWSSANKLAVPFQDNNTTPPRDGYMRINPVIFWVEIPERPNRPPLPRGAWHAAGIRFTVGSGIRKR